MTDSVFDVALEKRFTDSAEIATIDVTSADALLIRDSATGVVMRLPFSTLASAISSAFSTSFAALIDGKVPASQLPSYVDDVLEYANVGAFPTTGESGKIYVSLATNLTYRWSGSAYVEISASPGSTDAVPEGGSNLYFTNTRARAAVSASGSISYNPTTGVFSFTDAVTSVAGKTGAVTLAKSDVGLSNVDNTSDATKNAATATLENKTLVNPFIDGGTGDSSSNDAKINLKRTSSTGNVLAAKVVLSSKDTNYAYVDLKVKTTPSSLENDAYYATAARIDGQTGKIGFGVTPSNANGGILQLSSGVTFPAAQVASSDANTLDDYEEGTFTPTISAGSGSINTYDAAGKYTKVGDLVTVSIYYKITDNGTGAAYGIIGNLPFAIGGNGASCAARIGGTSGKTSCIQAPNGGSSVTVWNYDNTYPWATNAQTNLSFSYKV